MTTESISLVRWDPQANAFVVPPRKKIPKHTIDLGQKILPIIAAHAEVAPDDFMTSPTTTEKIKMFHSMYVGIMWEAYENIKKVYLALTLNRPVSYISSCLKLFMRATTDYEKKDAEYRFILKDLKWKIKEADLQRGIQEKLVATSKVSQNKILPQKRPIVPLPSLKHQIDAISLMDPSVWKVFKSTVSIQTFTDLLFETINNVVHVSKEEMQAKSGFRKIVFARMMFSVIMYETYQLSFYRIANFLGGKEHSSIMRYINEHRRYINPNNQKLQAKHLDYKLGFALLEREFYEIIREKFGV